MAVKEGQRFVLRGVPPSGPIMAVDPDSEEEVEIPPEDQEPEPLGVGPGTVFPGTEATVVFIDKKGDEPGVGEAGVPTVIVKIEEPQPTRTERGWEVTMVPRHVSIPLDQFNDMFEEA